MDLGLPTLPPLDSTTVLELMNRASEIGLRLELCSGGFTWEATPGYRHQELCLEIVSNLRPGRGNGECECLRNIDVAIRLGDGTVKRPDISIFCRRPEEMDGIVFEKPTAVIEITSSGYEDKDLIHGQAIYRRNGIVDVIVFDQRDNSVHHWGPRGYVALTSPVAISLGCGCLATI